MANSYTTETPRVGLTQFTFSNGWVLSVGYGSGHYASWVVGERFGPEGSHFFPTSYEVAVLSPAGDMVSLTEHDSVAGWQSLDMVQTILQKMEREDFTPSDLTLYCE